MHQISSKSHDYLDKKGGEIRTRMKLKLENLAMS